MKLSLSTHRKIHDLLEDATSSEVDMSIGRDAGREVHVRSSGLWTVYDLWRGGQIWGCAERATGGSGAGVEFEGPSVARKSTRATGEPASRQIERI